MDSAIGSGTVDKPPNTFRIAVIGDSFAEALQVDLDHTFWSVMERKLAEGWRGNGQRVEVLNFGVSGYGTARNSRWYGTMSGTTSRT